MKQLKYRLNTLLLLLLFVLGPAGHEYGIGTLAKLQMARRIRRAQRAIPALTRSTNHLVLAEHILGLPKSLKGDVVECGCYNGSSTASLSIACAATGRRLLVCDSFEGLPEPRDEERDDVHDVFPKRVEYKAGDLSSAGGLEGVKENVRRHGDIEACEFFKGYFSDTLPTLPTESVVMVFEDADLRSSVEDCLVHLWPKLQEGCLFYSHETHSLPVVGLFYDDDWWRENLGTDAPGYHGSGAGILEVLIPSALGYARKWNPKDAKRNLPRRDLDDPLRY